MMNETQRNKVKTLLVEQGVTFTPLLSEMIDHISCDVEDHMSEGHSFDEALERVFSGLPTDHFVTIQDETIAAINNRFTFSQAFSYLALILLFGSLIFKAMQLQFAGQIFLLSFVCIGASLLTGAINGIRMRTNKPGSIRVLAVISGVIILLGGFSFNLLRIPGANGITLLGIIFIMTAFLLNTWYAYKGPSAGNLLTFLHEKHTPGIERFLLLLLLPLAIYKVIAPLITLQYFGDMVFLIVIFGGFLQFIALTWSMLEKQENKKLVPFTAAMVSILCIAFIFLAPHFPREMRFLLIGAFSSVSGWLAYYFEKTRGNATPMVLAAFVSLIFWCLALEKLEMLPVSVMQIIFNLPVLLMLCLGVLVCRKHSMLRTYMIISLAAYLFEYPF